MTISREISDRFGLFRQCWTGCYATENVIMAPNATGLRNHRGREVDRNQRQIHNLVPHRWLEQRCFTLGILGTAKLRWFPGLLLLGNCPQRWTAVDEPYVNENSQKRVDKSITATSGSFVVRKRGKAKTYEWHDSNHIQTGALRTNRWLVSSSPNSLVPAKKFAENSSLVQSLMWLNTDLSIGLPLGGVRPSELQVLSSV